MNSSSNNKEDAPMDGQNETQNSNVYDGQFDVNDYSQAVTSVEFSKWKL